MKELLRHFDGEAAAAARQPLTADMVTPDDQGIRELIQVIQAFPCAICHDILNSFFN